jgi:hypothetical protein
MSSKENNARIEETKQQNNSGANCTKGFSAFFHLSLASLAEQCVPLTL